MADKVDQLQALESESWRTAASRSLYSTPDIPGFPWFTVRHSEDQSAGSPDTGVVVRRHVVPYDFTFHVFVKGRWVGRGLVDIYTEEFAHHSRAYYEACVRVGRLRCVKKKDRDGCAVRGNQRRRELKRGAESLQGDVATSAGAALSADSTTQDTSLAQGDVVQHTVHRHEIPVSVGISGVDAVRLVAVRIRRYGLLCVEKPAGVPTHSSGRYHMNSLLAMVEYVLAPKRLARWLWGADPLLQSLVDTTALSQAEKEELFDYYRTASCPRHATAGSTADEACTGDGGACERVCLEKAPRPCYRLDKVTSGVLLLGVHQHATKHVSQALMAKSLSMEMAAQKGTATTAAAAEGVRSILDQPVELRKHYLARVVGCAFPVFTGRADVVPLSEADAQRWFPSQPVTPGVRGDGDTHLTATYPRALLMRAPVPVQGIAALQPARGHKASTDLAGVPIDYQSAMTLCQCIAHESVPAAESLVHCVPLTGRLHQIRLHLLALGTPIVGDAHVSALSGEPTGTRPACAADVAQASSPILGVLFYDPQQLPSGYRAYLAEQSNLRAEATVPDAFTDGTRSAVTSTSPLGVSAHCYECAGRLPLSTIHEDSAESAICLHAWEYELGADLLKGGGMCGAHAEPSAGDEPDEQEAHSCEGTSGRPTRYCFRRGSMVVFRVPVPSWAVARAEDVA